MSNVIESKESTNNDSGLIPNNSHEQMQSQPLNIRPHLDIRPHYTRFHPPFRNYSRYNTYSYTPNNIPYTYPQYPNIHSNIHPNTYPNTHPNTYPNTYPKPQFQRFNPIDNCRSAGIIPYCLKDGDIFFLFQKSDNPLRRKDDGWNDFGGKMSNSETTFETAAREFSEETSCLFYLKEQKVFDKELYDALKNNPNLEYPLDVIEKLRKLIPISQIYFANKISQYASPLFTNSKEIYISYFVKVEYVPIEDIPSAEDIHIVYEDRYRRTCQWLSLGQILSMNEQLFHKRLQITKVQRRIDNFNAKGLFT